MSFSDNFQLITSRFEDFGFSGCIVTYKVSQNNSAVACCSSRATALYFLGHLVEPQCAVLVSPLRMILKMVVRKVVGMVCQLNSDKGGEIKQNRTLSETHPLFLDVVYSRVS